MPTYVNRCTKCEHTFETVQRMIEDPVKDCEIESCDGVPKRIIQSTNFHLKGSGWYQPGPKSPKGPGRLESSTHSGFSV